MMLLIVYTFILIVLLKSMIASVRPDTWVLTISFSPLFTAHPGHYHYFHQRLSFIY